MKANIKKFILSKVSRQYTKLHTILDVVEVLDNTIVVNVLLLDKAVNKVNSKGVFGIEVKPTTDRIEVIGIKNMVREYNLKSLGI